MLSISDIAEKNNKRELKSKKITQKIKQRIKDVKNIKKKSRNLEGRIRTSNIFPFFFKLLIVFNKNL